MRRCSRTACSRGAVATLTYVYADQTAVLGPLATLAEPHTYDLCAEHAGRLTAPRGWDVVRLVTHFEDIPERQDDLLAVADAVRHRSVREQLADRRGDLPGTGASSCDVGDAGPPARAVNDDPQGGERRAHLRVLRDVRAQSAER